MIVYHFTQISTYILIYKFICSLKYLYNENPKRGSNLFYFILFIFYFLFRQKKNLEMELHVTKGSVDDLKLLLDSHKKEILSLQESLVRHQVIIYITCLYITISKKGYGCK